MDLPSIVSPATIVFDHAAVVHAVCVGWGWVVSDSTHHESRPYQFTPAAIVVRALHGGYECDLQRLQMETRRRIRVGTKTIVPGKIQRRGCLSTPLSTPLYG